MWVIAGCKLLHIAGIHSLGALTSCLMILAYTLPFIRHVSLFLRSEAAAAAAEFTGGAAAGATGTGADLSGSAGAGGLLGTPSALRAQKHRPSVHIIELIVYIAIATIATGYARTHMIAHNALVALLSRDPTDLQQSSLCFAVWLAYIGCILLVFFRSAKLIRR